MSPRRILIVQTAYLGDLVLTTPLFDAVRRRWPAASIELVTTRAGAQLLAGDPRIDVVRSFDKRQTPGGVRSVLRLLREVRGGGAELAIAAQRSWRSGLIVRAAGSTRRVGFAGAAGAWAYTERVVWDAGQRQSERYVALIGAADATRPALAVDAAARRAVDARLQAGGIDPTGPWLCLAPGSARASKRWPAERYARLAALARRRGVPSAVVGSADERVLARRVVELAGDASAISLAGRVPLGELPALLSRAAVVVGNDSAPTHIAAAVETPVVTLFGPSSPRHGYAPRGERVRLLEADGPECRPCSPRGPRRCARGDLACLTRIEVGRVFGAAFELLEQRCPAVSLPSVS